MFGPEDVARAVQCLIDNAYVGELDELDRDDLEEIARIVLTSYRAGRAANPDGPRPDVEVAHTRNAGWIWRCHRCDVNGFNLTEDKAKREATEHRHRSPPMTTDPRAAAHQWLADEIFHLLEDEPGMTCGAATAIADAIVTAPGVTVTTLTGPAERWGPGGSLCIGPDLETRVAIRLPVEEGTGA
jgi:hypothetical protein